MARFLLTGAAGFIGSHVARALVHDGHEVHALLRESTDTWRIADLLASLRVVTADLESEALSAAVTHARPEVCLHLAWYAVPGQYLDSPENLRQLEASLRLVRAVADAGGRRFVGAGTCFEYELRAEPLSEDAPTRPTRLYAACKLALATVLGAVRPRLSLSTAWARLFYVYGPAEPEARLVPSVIRRLLRGETAAVTEGTQVRDYVHVKDVAQGLVRLALSGVEGCVNVGSGAPVTVRDVVSRAAEAAGRPDLVAFGARPQDPLDPPFVCADIRRLREEVGFTPAIGLPDGLRETVEWWSARMERAASEAP